MNNRPPLDVNQDLSRQDAWHLLEWILNNHLGALTKGDAGLQLGVTVAAFDADASRLEGLSRLLWGMTPASVGGFAVPGMNTILHGIANGTNPAHPAFWGVPGNMDQRLVEMAAIAVFIKDCPEQFKALPQVDIDNICHWLETIQSVRINPSNWRFFRILVIDALASLNWPVERTILADELDFIDRQYAGDGWYQDGEYAKRFDYYNAFAFHFYGLLYARWHAQDDAERSKLYVERARLFALSYRHWFAQDGAQICYGRSLTYRFGAAGFWGLLAEFGHPEISPAELHGLWSGAMRWWLDKPIWDPAGRFTLGYAYANLLMSEFYNSAQSPLWALKAFAPLALGADHPFWRQNAPIAEHAAMHEVPATKQMNWHANGVSYLAAPPPRHSEVRLSSDKYAKFAYSSHHGLCVDALRWISNGFAGDNILALSRDGQHWVFRDQVQRAELTNGILTTSWSAFDGCVVTATQRPVDGGELRSWTIETTSPLQMIATGHAVDLWVAPKPLEDVVGGENPSDEKALAIGRTLFSDIRDLDGVLVRRVLPSAPNTNLIFPHCAVPALIGDIPIGRSQLRVQLTAGRRSYAAG